MLKGNARYVGFILICLLLALMFRNYLLDSNTTTENNAASIDAPLTQASRSALSKDVPAPTSGIKGSNRQPLTPEKKSELLLALAAAKVWLAQRGFFTESDLREYRSYNDQTLFELVKSGDVKAMTVLGDRKFKQNQLGEAALLHVDCAIRGSVYCLYTLSNDSNNMYLESRAAGKLDEAKRFEVDMVAWQNLAVKRGLGVVIEVLPMSLTSLKPADLDNAEGLNSIKAAEQANYEQLEQHRVKLGLGNFDNSVEPAFSVIKSIEKNYYDPIAGPNDPRSLVQIYF